MDKTRFLFDEFEIDTWRRVLLRNGQTVALKPKDFDLLLALVENHGLTVSKTDLLDAVWEDQFVEEKNLSVHIATLRKALGEKKDENRFIATVPGTGYKFVATLETPSNGIVVETERIERITIEEESESGLTGEVKTASWSLKKLLLIALFPILLVSIVGGYFWQNNRVGNHGASSIRRLTTTGNVQLAALSPDGKLFAFVTNDLGKTALWLGYTAGGNNIQLRPPSEATYEQLTFSPDSSQLYFSMNDERNPNTSIYGMPVFGGAADKVSDGIGNFSLSPDGKQIAFGRGSDDGRVMLMVSDLDRKTESEILSVSKDQSFVYGSVSWSPDAKQMAFSCQREKQLFYQDLCLAEISSKTIERIPLPNYRSVLKTVWLKSNDGVVVTAIPTKNMSSVVNFQILRVEIPSGDIREITNDLNTYNSDISASDDSRSLLTIEHRQLNNVWVAPSDNFSQARQITFGSFGKYDGLWGLDWTPDGRIIFTNSTTETQHISVMNPDGNDRRDLTSAGFMDSALTVSNDGNYVVFHSIRGGTGGASDIWRMDIDGSNMKQLTFGNKSFQPSISPDNRYVYYKCWLKDVGEMRRVPIDGGEPEILTDKQTGWPTFSPNGRYIAATYLTDKRRLAIFSAETNQIIRQFDVPKTALIDMRPRWTPDSRAVVYRDGVFGYWSQSIDGGEAERLDNLPREKLYTYAWSKDGKQFAFVRGQEIRDVVLISDFK